MVQNAKHYEAKVEEQLTRLLFKNAGFALKTNIINGGLWLFATWDAVEHNLAMSWLACLLAINILRSWIVHSYLSEKRAAIEVRTLLTSYTLSTLASGVIWSAAAIMLIHTHDVALQALSGFLIAGMVASAVGTHASSPITFYAFSLPMLVPLPPLLILEGTRIPIVMGAICIAFIVFIIKTARNTHEMLRKSISLSYQNESLLDSLSHELDERGRAQAELAQSEQRFRALAESTDTAIFTFRDTFLYVNPAGEELTGYSMNELKGMPFWSIIHPEHQEAVRARHHARFNGETIPNGHELKVLTRSGEVRWLSFSACLIDQDGIPTGLGTAFDITARKAAEEALFLEKEMAQVTLKSLGDAVVTTDTGGRILSINPVGETLSGWEEAEARGLLFNEVFRLSTPRHGNEQIGDPVSTCISKGECTTYGSHLQLLDRKGNGSYSVELLTSPICDRNGRIIGAVAVFHDVSALSHAASHDALTGLVNRREFIARLEHAVSVARLDNAEHALCYIDLDQFKVVNDTCGHAAGDELLKQLTALLHAEARDGDTFARLGGDEFGLLLPHCPIDKAIEIAESIRKLVKGFRFNWSNRMFEIGASVGVVPIDKNNGSAEELMRAADSACYVAKSQGRNRVHVYQVDDTAVAEHQENIAWVSRIRQGLDEGDFSLYYQPIKSLGMEGGEHIEILLRLRDQQGNLIPPGAFIPAAERYDLMPSLDRWVIHNTFKKLAPMLREKSDRICAINLSAQSLSDEKMISFILEEIAAYGIPSSSICFEITETSAVSHLAKARELAQLLKIAGFALSLDDFGCGLSSFAYLKELPVDYLKIDGSFVRNIGTSPADRAIVSSIVQVARAMGKKTIAEYVENESDLYWVRTLDVDYAQGYFISQPRPIEELVPRDSEEFEPVPLICASGG